MRHPLTLILLATAIMVTGPVSAEDGLLDSLKEKAEPLLYALSLVGTPYKFGGKDPEKGVDCSGFVGHVYKKTAGIELPRSARQISQKGEDVEKEQLQPGDLVFFNTRKSPYSHVGIYAGDGKFIHSASSRSKQVMISDLKQKYWSQRFNGARRVLPDGSAAAATQMP